MEKNSQFKYTRIIQFIVNNLFVASYTILFYNVSIQSNETVFMFKNDS